MKPFRAVEDNRRSYHRDAARNSVHRASLLVPELPGSSAWISFLNHFMLKRGYEQVGCRITAIDEAGQRIESRLVSIDAARAYAIPLTGMVDAPAHSYLVEFFAAQNLFIPFPAVMVNHVGDGFLNTVHAYNRVLNDVFEDDEINTIQHTEVAIDLQLADGVDTFVQFAAGATPVAGDIAISVSANDRRLTRAVPVALPRFGQRRIDLAALFPEIAGCDGGVIRVRAPRQPMFFGRMLVGQRRADGAFSGNHSYYDCSDAAEYWDDARPSSRLYPFIAALDNRLRFYPIMAPGRLRLRASARDAAGAAVAALDLGTIASPGDAHLDIDLNARLRAAGVDPAVVTAVAVDAEPADGPTPTRINHQLVYGGGAGSLATSINMSLTNPNVFAPPGKTGFHWGQVPVGPDLDTWLGLVCNAPDGPDTSIELTLYDEDGVAARRTVALPAGGATLIEPDDLRRMARGEARLNFAWFELRSDNPDIYGYAVTRHRRSGHMTGEHAF
ncbi:MAG: hypothetical protein R3F55_23740 [Alphaproteobacteria bacterium]